MRRPPRSTPFPYTTLFRSLVLPFGRAAPDVVDGGPVGAHAHDDDAVEGGIGLPVPAAVQPVPAGHAAGCRDRAGAAELGQGGFGMDPLRTVADENEHLEIG